MAQEVKIDRGAAGTLPTRKLTYEEFLEWLDEDIRAEWVDGEVILMSPISGDHQDLGLFLLPLVKIFVEARQLGVVRYEPFQMKTGPDLPGRSPDLLFVANANLSRLKSSVLEGPADLVVEIISPDSRDRGEKFYEYEQGGVREYWLLDRLRKRGEFNQLGEDRLYHLAPIGEDGIFRSAVLPGFWLKVDWLWQESLPTVLSVLKQWGLV